MNQKTRMGEDPHVPPFRVLHAKNAVAFFAKHTRLLQSKNFAFAVSKKRRKLQGFLREELIELSNGAGAP
jgi:hypothetical protein